MSSPKTRYCPNCGSQLELRMYENRPRDFCPTCQRILYQQLKVGAGAVIEHDGKLLLLQRTRQPFMGDWNLPAGYVEADESPYQAVVREVLEEVGLEVAVDRLLDIYFYADDPRGNGILVVFKCRVTGGELRTSDEAKAFHYFAGDDVPGQLAGGGHNQAISAWQRAVNPPQ